MWEYDDALFLIETFSTGIYYCIVGFAWCNCRSRGTMFVMTLSHGEDWDKGISHQIARDGVSQMWLNRFTHTWASWATWVWSSAFPYPDHDRSSGCFPGFQAEFPQSCNPAQMRHVLFLYLPDHVGGWLAVNVDRYSEYLSTFTISIIPQNVIPYMEYTIWFFNSLPWKITIFKNGKPSISMGHGFHGWSIHLTLAGVKPVLVVSCLSIYLSIHLSI